MLTHWCRVTHICVSRITNIGSDNGLSPGRRQAIIWTNVGILLIRTLGTNFSEILSEIHTFSFKKMHLKMSSAKWRPFCLGLNVLTNLNYRRKPPSNWSPGRFRQRCVDTSWWRHHMEMVSALLALCEGNPSVNGGFPSQRPVTRTIVFPFICVWRNNHWANNLAAGDLRRHRAHYDITVLHWSWDGNTFLTTGHLWGKSTDHWFP